MKTLGARLFKKELATLFFVLAGIISGCGDAHMPGTSSGTSSGGQNQVSYDMIRSIFVSKCSVCHNASSPQPNWLDYHIAYAKKDRIYQRVVLEKSMPPAGAPTSLSDEERNQIANWINSGALETLPNGPSSGAGPSSNPIATPAPVSSPPPASPSPTAAPTPTPTPTPDSREGDLMKAGVEGNVQQMIYLLNEGVSPDIVGAQGQSLLTAVITNDFFDDQNYFEAVQILIKKKANLDRPYRGATPLAWAVYTGNTRIAKALIRGGCQLDTPIQKSDLMPMYESFSPLMLAVSMSQLETVKALVEAGAVVRTQLPNGISATSLAKRLPSGDLQSEIRDLLETYYSTYLRDVVPIFQRRCSSCHNDTWPARNWFDYDLAYAYRFRIRTRVVEEKTMPPNWPLRWDGLKEMNDSERQVIAEWADDGGTLGVKPREPAPLPTPTPTPTPTPNPAVTPTPIPTPSTGAVTYSHDILPIIQVKCAGCHNANWPGFNWLDYGTIFAKQKIVWNRIVVLQNMPPAGMPQLTDQERGLFKQWLSAGAPR